MPCVEPNVPGGLVYQEPDVLLQAGQCRRMPYMIGFNSLEGLIMLEGKLVPNIFCIFSFTELKLPVAHYETIANARPASFSP